MVNVLFAVFLILLAAACFGCYQGGKWRQRARAAEQRAALNRAAREVQDAIAVDPAGRERVRRQFDRS